MRSFAETALVPRRFDQAKLLRGYAQRVRDLRFRDAERYLEELDEIAHDMIADADSLVRLAEPTAESVFRTGRGQSAKGRPFRAETRVARAA